jgi:hypothetical protein
MGYIVYMANCNSAIHATCLLAFMAYKYNELQMFGATQNRVARPIAKHPFFLIVNIHFYH